MREIKFRGKDIKGNWHYGLLVHCKHKDKDYEWFISNSSGMPFAFGVLEKTIGQRTGLKDKNGVEIYEGDIVRWNEYCLVIEFREDTAGFTATKKHKNSLNRYYNFRKDMAENRCEVIGNVY